MQGQHNPDANISVNLSTDHVEILRAALLADVRDRARNVIACLDDALDATPIVSPREDVAATFALVAEDMALLDTIGWGEDF